MINRVLYWVLVLALQFFLLNHLDISAYLIPQVFIILLITLPLHISKIKQVLIAFAIGLLADFFVSTPGIHASACLWLILLRMFILGRQDLKQHEANKLPYYVNVVGLVPFIYTVTILVLFYHFYVFWLESIGAVNGVTFTLTSLFSSFFALTIISVVQFVSLRNSGE
ncbi:MAG: hypothetical protein COA58_00505 [Bacteroidetes bacterium]|nr:MAG: hypothetical protein COA58_00505 [Bacteroidota bacterium]